MQVKLYRMRSQAVTNGKASFIDLDIEFEGSRAFAIWDSIEFGRYKLKARLEINPRFLHRAEGRGCDFYYTGELVLPRPECN
jgi:hypothetical protein